MRLVASRRRQLLAGGLGTLVLDDAEQEITERPDQSRDGECATTQRGGEDPQAKEWQREQGIDDGDVVPADPVVGERPEELGAVRGAAVQQAVRGIANQAREVGFPGSQGAPHDPVQQYSDECGPDRDEHQRMRELAVVLEKQQRIRG